jgi:hypothetical protein
MGFFSSAGDRKLALKTAYDIGKRTIAGRNN